MSRFTERQKLVLGALMDVLIPEAEGMPAATAVGGADQALDEIANARSDIVAALLRVARVADGKDAAECLAALKVDDPEGFAALTLATAGGYYTRPEIRTALGYRGPSRHPVDVSEVPDFLALDLLRPVIARGEIWRKV